MHSLNDNGAPAGVADFPTLFDAKTAAALLGISYATLRSWVSTGRIGYSKVGGRLKFTADQLSSVVETHPATGRGVRRV